jgi:transposase
LHEVTRDLLDEPQALKSEVRFKSARIEQFTFELARYKRIRFDRSSEKLDRTQASLLEEALDEDLSSLEEELEQLQPTPPAKREKSKPRREHLPEHLPRAVLHHEPESTVCACGCQMKRIGEDVS